MATCTRRLLSWTTSGALPADLEPLQPRAGVQLQVRAALMLACCGTSGCMMPGMCCAGTTYNISEGGLQPASDVVRAQQRARAT